jgi:hypothetical protein
MTTETLMAIAPEFADAIFVYDNDPALGTADYDDVKNSLETAVNVAAFLRISDEVATKVTEDNSFAGVLFQATISKAVEDAYTVKAYGIIITPKVYVEGAGAFTIEALEAYVASKGYAENRAYLRAEPDGFYATGDTTYTFAGGFADFSLKTHEKNPEFLAIAYAVVEINGADVMVYGNGTTCIRVKETMMAARENLYKENATDERLAVYDTVIASFGE